MNAASSLLNKGFEFKIGNFTIAPAYWQAVAIVFLLFFLVITLAQVRRHFLDYSVKGGFVGIFIGFILALVIEGFLLIGGRTILTETLGWKTAPKPISNALDYGRSKFIGVLGTNTLKIPDTQAAEKPTYASVVQNYQSLTLDDARRVRPFLCK